jgi:hypothetical protein
VFADGVDHRQHVGQFLGVAALAELAGLLDEFLAQQRLVLLVVGFVGDRSLVVGLDVRRRVSGLSDAALVLVERHLQCRLGVEVERFGQREQREQGVAEFVVGDGERVGIGSVLAAFRRVAGHLADFRRQIQQSIRGVGLRSWPSRNAATSRCARMDARGRARQ